VVNFEKLYYIPKEEWNRVLWTMEVTIMGFVLWHHM